MHTSKTYRDYARAALRSKWGLAIIVTLIASMLGGAFNVSINISNINQEEIRDFFTQVQNYNYAALIETVRNFSPAAMSIGWAVLKIGLVSSLISLSISGIIMLGRVRFFLSLLKKENARFDQLFSFFAYWKKAVLLNLYTTILIYLWSLLFVIPGIVAAYRYSMAPYIMAENPTISAKQAVEESKKLMSGKKASLFVLHLSFIGWWILSALSFGIGFIWLIPYMYASETAFYLDCTNRLIPPMQTQFI